MKHTLIFCFMIMVVMSNLSAQVPEVQFTYNAAGLRVLRVFVNPVPFVQETHSTDTVHSTDSIAKEVLAENSSNGSVKGNAFIYPNPVSTQLNIIVHDEAMTNAKVRVFDITGRTVLSSVLKGSELQLNVYDLEPSAYFVELLAPNSKKCIYKVIKN